MRWHLMMASPIQGGHRQMWMQMLMPPQSHLPLGSLTRQRLAALEPQLDTHSVIPTTPLSVRTSG
jgi:hypothetical protein